MATGAEPQAGTTFKRWPGWESIVPGTTGYHIGIDRLGRAWIGCDNYLGGIKWTRLNDPEETP